MKDQLTVTVPKLIPLAKFNHYFPDPSPAALRHLLRRNPKNFRRCVVRRVSRILIDVGRYYEWLEEQNEAYSIRQYCSTTTAER